VELYSPEGKCQNKVAAFTPPLSNKLVSMLWNNQVLVCGESSTKCYSYGLKTGVWSTIPSVVTHSHLYYPGSTYNNKIYLAHNVYPEVFDPTSNTVTSWPVLPITGQGGCMVTWKDTFIYFGGSPNYNTVFQYSHITNNWTALASVNSMSSSSCVVLPNQNVLVTASSINSAATRYAEYNVTSNTWLPFSFGFTPRYESATVVLGKRVFSIAGYGKNSIEEYHYINRTVSTKPFQLLTTRSGVPNAIALPAYFFSHLPKGCAGVL
jgi:hypothetical protein